MRQATREDLLELLRMAREFAKAAGEDMERERVVSTMENLMDSEDGIVLYDEGAMLAAMIFESPFSGKRVCQELFWWVDEDRRQSGVGAELLEGLESWAGFNGAERLIMVALQQLTPRKLGKIYRARGFKPLEHSYVKDL